MRSIMLTQALREARLGDSEPIVLAERRVRPAAPQTSRDVAPAASVNQSTGPSAPSQTSFDRHELRIILGVYGRMVAAGEWRDYAIDCLRDMAVFSVFRRTSEMPLYRIVKDPKLARRQGAYSVVTPTGLILRRGHDLARVLAAIDKRLVPVGA
jgi:hypothetical protein